MKRTLAIRLGDDARSVAILHYNQQGARESAAVEYDPAWLASPGGFALDPALPLVRGPQFHARGKDGSIFHAVIADTEPDGWGRRVIQRDHAKRRQRARKTGGPVEATVLTDLDYLLAVDDVSRVGALRFQDEAGVFHRPFDEGHRTTPPLLELSQLLTASRAVETNTDTAEDLAYLRGRGTSLGGLRPKCSVVDDDGGLSIGKFPSVTDERAVTKGEVLALHLASKAGVDAALAKLVHSDGVPVAVIRRFDRPPGGGRLMYVSAATMLGADTGDGVEHTYTEIADALRQHGSRAQSDIEELWRRIAYSVLITNVDDHLLNHGFLHVDRGQWRLAPAFDVNPFPERVRELKTWISEDAGPEATVEALMSVIGYFRITKARAKTILAEVLASVARWRAAARALGMTKHEIEQFSDAFEHREKEAARRAAA